MSTSSRTTSTSSTEPGTPVTVVIALGSNLGPRELNLRRAVEALRGVVRVVRVSRTRETEPVDAPSGSPPFLNAAAAGWTRLDAAALMGALLAIERRLGRVRGTHRNEPRVIDLDLIVYGGHRIATPTVTVPHPRAASRRFVTDPMRDLGLETAIAFLA